ncbi:hypothetical protein FACS189456_2150 [Bacteroidia bacterium]|nr:hypothetical protein FACS189456_2150 [Bacteroidia bacterium]
MQSGLQPAFFFFNNPSLKLQEVTKSFFIMRKTCLSFAAASVLALGACNDDVTPEGVGKVVEVALTSNIGAKISINARAGAEKSLAKVANDQFETGDRIGVYLKGAGTTLSAATVVESGINAAYNAVGNTLTPITPAYYPALGNVDIVAYYPHQASVGSNYTIPVSVGNQANGLAQEVLYANNVKNQASTPSAVALTFRYTLAKLSVTITKDDNVLFGAQDFANMTVSVAGVNTSAALSLADGTLSQFGGNQSVTLYKKNSTATGASFEALVVPHAATGNVTFEFAINGRDYTFQATNKKYEAGYNYAITFNLTSSAVNAGDTEITPRENEEENNDLDADNPLLPARAGSWLFDDASDLFKAENGGTALVPGTGSPAVFGGTAGFSAAAGPSAGNGAIHVNRGNFLKATHGMAPSGVKPADGNPAERVNEYTIFLELKCATEDKDRYYKSLLKIKTEDNTRDADWFMRTGYTGTGSGDWIGGGSLPSSPAGSVQPDVWNRVLVSVKSGEFCSVYLNGVLISQTASNYRSIDDERSSLLPTCLFFADEDGEDAAWDVAEIAIWNIAFDSVLVTTLEHELSLR